MGSTKTVRQVQWLGEVQKTAPPLSELSPIFVRSGRISEGPAIPPELHPNCEVGILVSGEGETFIGTESQHRRAGDVLLAGPGIPHWFRISKYPLEYVTIHFLPSLLMELGPERDGAALLRCFTAGRSAQEKVIRLPEQPKKELCRLFAEIAETFDSTRSGREFRLRCLFLQILLKIVPANSHEASAGRAPAIDWVCLERILAYIRDHYSEPIYAKDLCRISGLSESRLKMLFKEAVGAPWTQYLLRYRIQRACVRLADPQARIMETALSVGFETLSHFNASFRKIMGMTPREFICAYRSRQPV